MRFLFFFSSRRRHTRSKRDWSSDVCSSDLDDFLRRPTPIPVASTEYCECMSLSPQNDPPASGSIPAAHARARRWRRFRARLRLFRRRMHTHPALRLPWRILVGTTGTLIVLIGFVFFVTPGPGIASVLLG